MSDLTKLSAVELSVELTKGSVSAVEVTKVHLDRINSLDKSVQSFLHVDNTGALKQAEEVDKNRKENKKVSALAGVPLALKDVLTQKGIPTTCGSKILEGWIPPYDSFFWH